MFAHKLMHHNEPLITILMGEPKIFLIESYKMYRAICITAAHQKKNSLEKFMTVFDQLFFYPFHWKTSFNAYFNYE